MRRRQREDQSAVRQVPPAEQPGTETVSDTRVAAEHFLAAADEAIDRALSGDSEAFLTASRQTSAQ